MKMTPLNSQAKVLISKPLATNPSHPCLFCDKVFQKYCKLEFHMNLHIEQKPYQCLQCPSSYGDPRPLARHVQVIHFKVRHKCDACKKYFSDRYSLKRHVQNRCDGVSATFAKQSHRHICLFCDKKFVKYSELEYHTNAHIRQKPYQCLKCPVHFTSPRYLRRHVKVSHLQIRYECSKCDAHFSRRHTLRLHLLRGNCNKVSATFAKHGRQESISNINKTKSSSSIATFAPSITKLENAIKVSTSESTVIEITEISKTQIPEASKPKISNNAKFKNTNKDSQPETQNTAIHKTSLVSNAVQKRQDRVTKCFVCPAIFSRRDNMIDHYRKNHLKTTKCVKIISCVPCNIKFENQSQLASHQLSTHSKKFQCTICLYTFARSDGLKRHLKRCTPSTRNSNLKTKLARKPNENVTACFSKHSNSQKNYQCQKCKTKFTRRSNLTRHTKRQSCSVNSYSETVSELTTEEVSDPEEEDGADASSQTETELADKAENNSDDDQSIDQEDDFNCWEELVLMKRNERRQANNKYDFFLHLNRYNISA